MRPCITEPMNEEGVTRLMEYIIITGVLLLLMIVMMFSVNASIMEGPANKLRYHAFVDIGNGISTRIVDLYVIAPGNGTIETKFDIPDDVAGRGYFVDVDVEKKGASQTIQVQSGSIKSTIAIAGIGATRGVVGNTTGAGWNMIQYDSKGFSGG
ncbi:hypothetical protein [Methanoculleus sp. UBA303]|uniref:hypothetical protein n=1 Tax=Methanoculleus sp. UBA303 TaxID=1915497 RepID=UPI0025D16E6F|nr:hypothetical protein [Methanoculleus sp. UBA303]MDD3932547.1 hypothetical protein [Methanoculleus sp.]